MPEIAKPVPAVTPQMAPFFEAARHGELKAPRCAACGALRFSVRENCTQCFFRQHDSARVGGRDEALSFNMAHQVYHPAYAGEIPYVVVMIKLKERPAIVSNRLGVKPDRMRCGMPVEVVFEKVNDQVSSSKFRPRAAG
ncbi:OB-fold domain-containing protein [bacterium]|nr:OB-fold domain-containing protein [bacterium]